MKDRDKGRELPSSRVGPLCLRISELEGRESGPQLAQEDFSGSHEQHCTLAETINDGLAMIDENMQLVYVNSRFCEIIGYSRDEVIGRSASDFLAEADNKIAEEQLARRKTGKSDPYELTWIRKDGQRAFVLMSPRPIFAPDGSFKGSIGVITDITDRKRAEEALLSTTQKLEVRVQERTADLVNSNEELRQEIAERKRIEEALRESEQRYSRLFKNNHAVMLLIDPENADIVDVNPAACSFYGWTQEELTGMKITDINMLPSEQVFEEIEKAKSEKRNHFFFRHRMANEEIRDVEVYSGPIRVHGKELLCSIIHDISERKQAQEALRESEERFRELAELLPQTIFELDLEGNLTYSNRCGLETFGYSRDDITKGINAIELFIPAESERIKQNLEKKLAGEEFEDHEYIGLKKDGSNFPVLVYSSPVIREDKPVGLRGIVLDITERKQAELQLRDSKKLFEKVFASQQDAFFILDSSKPPKIVDCNPAASKVFGYNRQEMLGQTTNFLHINESSLRKFQDLIYPSIEEVGFVQVTEFEMKRKNDKVFPTEHTVQILEDEKGERIGWISVVRDISESKHAEEERKKLEAQLLQAKKLEAISTLSGGVAQELSSLFQAVHGYVERLMWGKEQDDPRYQELLEITNAAFRGAVLSKRLLAFSGVIDSKKKQIELNKEIKKTYKLLRRTLPETIKLKLKLAKDSTLINGDPNQIEQALLALAVNARDAMPTGGKISIETKRMVLDEAFRRAHVGAAMGECVLISLSDTGPGLGQETLEHVFDPFYSKEDPGENTGLGLSMVYGIVKNHGGYITCASQPDMGTTFKIYLPITKQEAD